MSPPETAPVAEPTPPAEGPEARPAMTTPGPVTVEAASTVAPPGRCRREGRVWGRSRSRSASTGRTIRT
jgi:hypothetical protein